MPCLILFDVILHSRINVCTLLLRIHVDTAGIFKNKKISHLLPQRPGCKNTRLHIYSISNLSFSKDKTLGNRTNGLLITQ